ncbi:MAG: DegV family protein [Dehalococcoidia bacterium]
MQQSRLPTAIVTDSNISLPSSLIEGLPLCVVPLEIHHEGHVYQDGVDISPTRFYEMQTQGQELPRTSAPQPGAFLRAFEQAAAMTDHVICITLAAHLSATHDAAASARRQAAESLPGLDITLVDSKSAGTAQGLIALGAARQAQAGESSERVLETIHERIQDTCLYGYLDTLYYVWKGGRVPRVLMWMGNLLQMKPVLQLYQGEIGMIERPRSARRAMDRLVALASQRLDGRRGRIAVMHANDADGAARLAERLQQLDPVEMFTTEFTPVIGAHTGPGLVGCAMHPVEA